MRYSWRLIDNLPDSQEESLKDAVNHVEQEARMILPGIQALFGFQLIAVFNEGFWKRLGGADQKLHWLALTLSALAILLSMAPAAYHRLAEPDRISKRFVKLATCWLALGMIPLMIGICLDLYLIGIMISGGRIWSLVLTFPLFACFAFLWFVFPMLHARRRSRS